MLAKALTSASAQLGCSVQKLRRFTATSFFRDQALPPRRKISDSEIIESFLKGTGPGGQKINKTSSAVQLKHIPTGIVVKSQATRSREQNRKYARQLLGEKLDEMEHGQESRTAIKAERARVKKASASKKSRRKHRQVVSGKAAGQQSDPSAGDHAVKDSSTAQHHDSDSQ